MQNDTKNKQKQAPFGAAKRGRATVDALFYFVIPLMLVAALIVLGFWGNAQKARAEGLRRNNEDIYTQAYTELTDSVNSMNNALAKLLVSNSNANLALTFDELWKECGTITALMGRIPQSHAKNCELTRFLAQTGDYARQLSASLMGGQNIDGTDREQLSRLLEAGERVHSELSECLTRGDIPLAAIDGEAYFEFDEQEAAETGEKYPTLVYEGPFSNSTEQREPSGLSGEDIDEEAAKTAALSFIDGGALIETSHGLSEGKLPYYGFTLLLENGRNADIAITKRGGMLLYLNENSSLDGEARNEKPDAKTLETMENIGREYLKNHNFGEFEPTYVKFYDDSVLIDFVAVMNVKCVETEKSVFEPSEADTAARPKPKRAGAYKVKLYPDLVKIRISRDDMRVVGVDARNLLFNRRQRDLDTGLISEERAAAGLFKDAGASRGGLALIPMDDNTERLCYEFLCSLSGRDYIVYIDAYTGEEVRVLRLIDDENGTLTV